MTEIGNAAFQYATLTEVRLPNTLETIGNGSFFYAHLMHISIPNSVKTIGSQAFRGCLRMSVTLPSSIQTIEIGAFDTAGIYLDTYPEPSGWYRDPIPSLERDWERGSAILFNCTYGYDDGQPYVQSYINSHTGGVSRVYPVPYRKGYTFMGWALQENGEVVYGTEEYRGYDPNRDMKVTYFYSPISDIYCYEPSNSVLYAVWQKI